MKRRQNGWEEQGMMGMERDGLSPIYSPFGMGEAQGTNYPNTLDTMMNSNNLDNRTDNYGYNWSLDNGSSSTIINSSMAKAVMEGVINKASREASKNVAPWSSVPLNLLTILKSYFSVSHLMVLMKLLYLGCPYLFIRGTDTSSKWGLWRRNGFQVELYIPLMSLITFALLCSGLNQSSDSARYAIERCAMIWLIEGITITLLQYFILDMTTDDYSNGNAIDGTKYMGIGSLFLRNLGLSGYKFVYMTVLRPCFTLLPSPMINIGVGFIYAYIYVSAILSLYMNIVLEYDGLSMNMNKIIGGVWSISQVILIYLMMLLTNPNAKQ